MFLTSIFQSNCVINLFYIGLDLAVVNLPIAAHEKSVISRSDLGGGGGGVWRSGVITFPETRVNTSLTNLRIVSLTSAFWRKRDQKSYEQQKLCGERGLIKLSSLSVKTNGRTFAYSKKGELILLRYFN